MVISFKLVPGLMKILNILQQIKGLEPTLNVLSEELSNLNVKKKLLKKTQFKILNLWKIYLYLKLVFPMKEKNI